MTSLSCQVKHQRGMPIGCPVEQENTFSYCLVQLSWILLFVAEQPVIEKIWQEKESLILAYCMFFIKEIGTFQVYFYSVQQPVCIEGLYWTLNGA